MWEEQLVDPYLNMVGARIKIVWEEQLADPPTEFITPVNEPSFSYLIPFILL